MTTKLDESKQAYNRRRDYVLPDDADVERASLNARAKRDQEDAADQVARLDKIKRIGDAEGSACSVLNPVLETIQSAALRAKLKAEFECAEFEKAKARDEELLRLARDRLVLVTDQCPCERADGSMCGKPLRANQVECSACRNLAMRKPSNVSPKEWELEKQRRAKARADDSAARRQRNKELLRAKASAKKLKVKQASPPQSGSMPDVAAAGGVNLVLPSLPPRLPSPLQQQHIDQTLVDAFAETQLTSSAASACPSRVRHATS